MMLALWIALNSLLIVWLVQQAWLFSAHYIHLFASGGLPNCILVKQAWRNRYRYQGFACSAFWWWLISVVALFGLLVFEVGFFPVYWLKKVDRVVFFNYLIYFLGYWLCVLALLFLFVALWRIDWHVHLLPDTLLLGVALLGALQAAFIQQLPFITALFLFFIVLLAFSCLNKLIERPWFIRITRWLGLGDIKFLLVAFFWLSSVQIMLMWLYAAAICWFHQAWLQTRIIPRGYCAFGPYLIFGWPLAKWVHPAVQYGYPIFN